MKTETATSADSLVSDTVQQVMTSAIDEEEPEDFNESDYGDPGLEATKKTFNELQDHVQRFLTNLLNKKVDSIVDRRFFNLSPGPGVLGFITEGKSSEFLSHPDVASLLSGTSPEAFLESIYTQEFMRCDAESLPDGIYINTSYVDPLDESIYVDTQAEIVKDFNRHVESLTYRYASDFHFKRTDEDGIATITSISTFLRDGKLFVLLVDSRDCGA